MHAGSPGSRPGLGEYYSRCKNLALYIRDCEYLCLSDETVKAVGPFYLVSMPGEVKYPTQGVMCNLSWTPHSSSSSSDTVQGSVLLPHYRTLEVRPGRIS